MQDDSMKRATEQCSEKPPDPKDRKAWSKWLIDGFVAALNRHALKDLPGERPSK